MGVVVIGLNHRSSPVEVRERFAFAEAHLPKVLAQMREELGVPEAVVLSTCNRVELYAATETDGKECCRRMVDFLCRYHDYTEPLEDSVYTFTSPESLRHLFRVASGLDSMVLGETEILGQLKKAYKLSLDRNHTGKQLNQAFQKAFHTAKHIRTQTLIQRGSISVGSVAVELAEKIFDSLEGRCVMVIGAGDTSEKTARFLMGRGVSKVVVTNRSHDRAEALARELGGEAVPFTEWHTQFDKIDIIISSTSAPHYVLDRARMEDLMEVRGHRPILLIDIAVPRDLDPELMYLENVFLYNIDDLQAIADDYLKQREEEVVRCEKIIEKKVSGLCRASAPSTNPIASWDAGSKSWEQQESTGRL